MILSAFLHGFDWSGRARRRDLWAFVAFCLLLLAGAAAAEVWLANGAPQAPRFVYVLGALLLVPLISLGVRRLHDLGHRGGWLALSLLPWICVLLWAYLLFAPTNNRADVPDTPVGLTLLGGVTAGLVTLLVASRVFWAPYWVVSASMKPGLLVGDYLMAGFLQAGDLERGDVVVFRRAADRQTMIARLIGLPGDTVQMQAGQIMLNGSAVPQTALAPMIEVFAPQGPLQSLPRCGNAPVGAGGQCITTRLTETLPDGRSYDVLDLSPVGPVDDTPPYTVPANAYFLLGDHRDDSTDSRFATSIGGMGYVDGKDVIGRANRVLFSAEGHYWFAVWNWRSGRNGMAVE